jgi:hypothetical protein
VAKTAQDKLIEHLAQVLHDGIVPVTIGRAAIAWNNLVYAIFALFQTLSGLSSDQAKRVFFAVRSDKNQREMVQGLIDNDITPIDDELAKSFKKLFRKIDGAAKGRNDTVHVILMNDGNPEKTHLFHDVGSFKGKVGRTLLTEMNKATLNCIDLTSELYGLHSKLLNHNEFRNRALSGDIARFKLLYRYPRPQGERVYGLLGHPPSSGQDK